MATFHFSIKSGRTGKAAAHSAYIAREGRFGKKQRLNDLIVKDSGNLPAWARGDAFRYWLAADRHERRNGAAYREFEVALPVELNTEQQRKLVLEFIDQQVGVKAFQYAIHSPVAALGSCRQPHAHIMFSDRLPDEIERPADQHFKRYNSKEPGSGGCRKDSGGKDRLVLRNELVERRKAWADLSNAHLHANGHDVTVDHRSNLERGIARAPERHLGQARINCMTMQERALVRSAPATDATD